MNELELRMPSFRDGSPDDGCVPLTAHYVTVTQIGLGQQLATK
jgi:hypothetical protein